MPMYGAWCDACKRETVYFRHQYEPKPYPDCEFCAGRTRWKPSLVSVPAEWREYYDHGLGAKVSRMADIERAVRDASRPQPYRDTVTGEMREVPGRKLVNAGRIHGA